MWVNLLLVPKDWICESCLSNNIVSPEARRKKDMIRNMTLDFPDIVCHESMHTTGPSSRGQAYSKRQKHVETGKVKFIPTEEVIKLSSGASEKGNRFRVKVYRGLEPSRLVRFPRHGGVHSMTNQPPPQALKKLKGNNIFFFFSRFKFYISCCRLIYCIDASSVGDSSYILAQKMKKVFERDGKNSCNSQNLVRV